MEGLPRLRRFGDKTEQRYWERLRKFVPHYEEFWQLYVLPLRRPESIWFREDISPCQEDVAIANYSTFEALGRAHQQVFANEDSFQHIEEVYMTLQRAGELGVKLIDAFKVFEADIVGSPSRLTSAELDSFVQERLSKYRNLLHDAIMSMPKERKRRKIPRPEKIDEYRRWTRVMYHYKDDDFVFASDQARTDFKATASRLEKALKEMCSRYEALRQKALSQVFTIPERLLVTGSLAGGPPASGDYYIGVDANQIGTRARFRLPRRS